MRPGALVVIVAAALLIVQTRATLADPTSSAVSLDRVAGVWRVTLTAMHAEISRGDRRIVHGWTYDGVVPGPLIVVPQDALVEVTMRNGDPMTDMTHGLDIHAAQLSPVAFEPVPSGKTLSYSFKASVPGAYLYHCSGQPMLQHLANGMFGAFVVVPKNAVPVRSFVIVQNEWYASEDDVAAMATGRPVMMTFNGTLNALVRHPLLSRTGETVRFYLVDAGPNQAMAFHIIGALLHRFGTPDVDLVQTVDVPPGSGAIVEARFAQAGRYTLLSHALGSAYLGAMGYIDVTDDAAPPADMQPELVR
jgi:nitrite reductase (NO-forming)